VVRSTSGTDTRRLDEVFMKLVGNRLDTEEGRFVIVWISGMFDRINYGLTTITPKEKIYFSCAL